MIPDCSADLRWPIGRQAAPSSVNYQRPEAERGQQSIENTPPAGGWRGPSRRRGPQGRIIAPLSTTENWPFGRQRRWHLQLFDPDLSPTLAQRSCQHGAHGEIECAWNWDTGSLERPGRWDGREAPKRANSCGWAVASSGHRRHQIVDAFGVSRCPYSATGQPCPPCSASTPQ